MDELELAQLCAEQMLENDAASRALGIEVEILAAGSAVARMTVRDDMVNGLGICHGGILFALGDTAFAFACNAYNLVTVGGEASIRWLQPAKMGDHLTATASEERREGRHGYYSISISNQNDEPVADFHGHCISIGKPLLDVGQNDT